MRLVQCRRHGSLAISTGFHMNLGLHPLSGRNSPLKVLSPAQQLPRHTGDTQNDPWVYQSTLQTRSSNSKIAATVKKGGRWGPCCPAQFFLKKKSAGPAPVFTHAETDRQSPVEYVLRNSTCNKSKKISLPTKLRWLAEALASSSDTAQRLMLNRAAARYWASV